MTKAPVAWNRWQAHIQELQSLVHHRLPPKRHQMCQTHANQRLNGCVLYEENISFEERNLGQDCYVTSIQENMRLSELMKSGWPLRDADQTLSKAK